MWGENNLIASFNRALHPRTIRVDVREVCVQPVPCPAIPVRKEKQFKHSVRIQGLQQEQGIGSGLLHQKPWKGPVRGHTAVVDTPVRLHGLPLDISGCTAKSLPF